jgi:hypothetical protein
MSRNDSRQVSCANAFTCANGVFLPTFMHHPGSFTPASIAKPQSEVQIVDTPETLETRVSTGLAVD